VQRCWARDQHQPTLGIVATRRFTSPAENPEDVVAQVLSCAAANNAETGVLSQVRRQCRFVRSQPPPPHRHPLSLPACPAPLLPLDTHSWPSARCARPTS
jgi:hypothetical protein